MKLFIKNMVCNRCIMVVKAELEKLGLHPINVALGEAEILEEISEIKKNQLLENLKSIGFDFIDDKKCKVAEKIKNLILELVHSKNNEIKINLSTFLSENLNQDYKSLSNLFSEIEKVTIEKYFINQKIEKVKELMIYDEMNLNEIANYLNYSSVAHLSNQFKKVTGFSPTNFKHMENRTRNEIDCL